MLLAFVSSSSNLLMYSISFSRLVYSGYMIGRALASSKEEYKECFSTLILSFLHLYLFSSVFLSIFSRKCFIVGLSHTLQDILYS